MEMMNPWVKQGWDEGMQAGKEQILIRQISRRFGVATSQMTERLHALSSKQLDALSDALFDFKTSADLENWLAQHTAQ